MANDLTTPPTPFERDTIRAVLELLAINPTSHERAGILITPHEVTIETSGFGRITQTTHAIEDGT